MGIRFACATVRVRMGFGQLAEERRLAAFLSSTVIVVQRGDRFQIVQGASRTWPPTQKVVKAARNQAGATRVYAPGVSIQCSQGRWFPAKTRCEEVAGPIDQRTR